jgi:hypothetical protein
MSFDAEFYADLDKFKLTFYNVTILKEVSCNQKNFQNDNKKISKKILFKIIHNILLQFQFSVFGI